MAQEWSPVRRILSTCEETPRKQDKNLVISVSLKTQSCSWNVLSCPSQCSR